MHKPSHLQEGQKAPGQLLVHYAPTVPALLFDGSVGAMRKAMLAEAQQRQARGEHVGVLIADEDFAAFQGSGACVYVLGSTLEQVAARLFAGLRVLEESEVNVILCRSFEAQGLGLAIRDRLLKASGGNVISL
jgi:L-threonylcarbamoyladenylate synthase